MGMSWSGHDIETDGQTNVYHKISSIGTTHFIPGCVDKTGFGFQTDTIVI